MASGKWSIPNLISYLVSVKDTLTVPEMDKLRQTAVFSKVVSPTPAETPAPRKRHLASQLYEPSDVLSALNLPILEWLDEKWKPHSAEGWFCD